MTGITASSEKGVFHGPDMPETLGTARPGVPALPVYYDDQTAEFTELRRRDRGFVFPWTVAFLSWYLLYAVMSNWAHDFINIKLGNINVALVFGLLQFLTTFLLAWHYSRFSTAKLNACMLSSTTTT